MADDRADIHGRVRTRPWRVGLLIDTTDEDAVRGAIASMSRVWGGRTMPIMDINLPPAQIEEQGELYDVDSLYAENAPRDVQELLRKPGWSWGYGGPWGPFRTDELIAGKGLLPCLALEVDPNFGLLLPYWEASDPQALLHAATWGSIPDEQLESLGTKLHQGPARIPLKMLPLEEAEQNAKLGLLTAGMRHVIVSPRVYMQEYAGLYVVRTSNPRDVVEFWNMRTYNPNLRAFPADGDGLAAQVALAPGLPASTLRRPGGQEYGGLRVWGAERLLPRGAAMISEAAERAGLEALRLPPPDWPQFTFQGLETTFTRSFRVQCRPENQWVDIDVPTLPLAEDLADLKLGSGAVATEVVVRGAWGLDPRFTAALPPFRRHAALIRPYEAGLSVSRGRVVSSGIAFGLDASTDFVRYPFFLSERAIGILFDDEAVKTGQSDSGRFQTRAGVKFGGAFSGLMNEPGVRKVLTVAAGRPTGLTLPHLRQLMERYRGEWPEDRFSPGLTPRQYATEGVNYLLQQGVFVPTLRVHCAHCRVEQFVAAENLGSSMVCEFCGQSFSLGLSKALAPPEWRYRLAAHLRPDQVQAMLPPLAVMSLLRQLRHQEEPPLTHVLGLELSVDSEKVEVDIAAYIPEHDYVAILGEVKTGNRIDAKDVANLGTLADRLLSKGVRCLPLLATLDEKLDPDETTIIRRLADESDVVTLGTGQLVPAVPLVLTGPDLSHPYWSDTHPWRWETEGIGLFATALESCRRNLGLRDYELSRGPTGPQLRLTWDQQASRNRSFGSRDLLGVDRERYLRDSDLSVALEPVARGQADQVFVPQSAGIVQRLYAGPDEPLSVGVRSAGRRLARAGHRDHVTANSAGEVLGRMLILPARPQPHRQGVNEPGAVPTSSAAPGVSR